MFYFLVSVNCKINTLQANERSADTKDLKKSINEFLSQHPGKGQVYLVIGEWCSNSIQFLVEVKTYLMPADYMRMLKEHLTAKGFKVFEKC